MGKEEEKEKEEEWGESEREDASLYRTKQIEQREGKGGKKNS
jgi:hypothetical protein